MMGGEPSDGGPGTYQNQMNESLRNTTQSLRSSVRLLKSKLLKVRTDFDALALDIEKILDKFDRIDAESNALVDKLNRQYERRCRLAEKEIRSNILRELRNNALSLEEEEEDDDTDYIDIGIATTISILETFINIISGGDDGFEMMSRSVLFPCIYKKMVGEGSEPEKYFILKVPDDAVTLADLGREFTKSIIDKTPYQLMSERSWEMLSGEVFDWWKNEMIPALYDYNTPDISEEPLSLEEIHKWKTDEMSRIKEFAEVSDALQYMRTFKSRVDEESGARELRNEYLRRPGGVKLS